MTDFDQIKSLLASETSRRNTDMIAGLVTQRPRLFKVLFTIFLANEEPFSRRAAWVIDTITEKQPNLLEPVAGKIMHRLGQFSHDGLKRHALRMLNRAPLPVESDLGLMISLCFDWLVSPHESVAVKVYCMDILYRISLLEPDIRKELSDSIEWRMEEESPGFRSHAKKILKKIGV